VRIIARRKNKAFHEQHVSIFLKHYITSRYTASDFHKNACLENICSVGQ